MDDALVIEGNVADDKPSRSGGNAFYTDGGSRYVLVQGNASFDNPIGTIDFGPPPRTGDSLPYPGGPSKLNGIPYGSDLGHPFIDVDVCRALPERGSGHKVFATRNDGVQIEIRRHAVLLHARADPR